MKKPKGKISEKMLIGELVEKYPKAAEVLVERYGLHCVGCGMAMMETIEDGARAHGMKAGEIKKMLEDLEKSVTKVEV